MKKILARRITISCIVVGILVLFNALSYKVYAGANDTSDDKKEEKKSIVIQIGKKQKVVETLKGSFVKKKGTKYFKKQNGKLAKNLFFEKGRNVYYVNRKGEVALGWKKIKGHYYFFDRKSGKMRYDTKIDRVKITQKGIAKETKQNIAIVEVYITAQKIVRKISASTDSKSKKLYRCYLWMKKFPYRRYRTMKAARKKHPKDWDIIFAKDIFEKNKGCCASEACAFAYMAKVCGYEKVSICSDIDHAWVDIGGKLYDPLFAEARSFKDNYNARYTDYRKKPVYKKKL